MAYFDNGKNVEDYIAMAEGYDGAELIAVLRRHLPAGSTVLELGMGPGIDLDMLSTTYQAVGSDASRVFVDRYRQSHPNSDVLLLDAVVMDTDRTFDGVYSNKVLHHLSQEELSLSLSRQKSVLSAGGLILHTFWRGDKVEVMQGLRFVYYTEKKLRAIVERDFEILAMERYKEMHAKDSLYVVARRRD